MNNQYVLYVVDKNQKLIVCEQYTHEQLLRWVFEFDMQRRALGAAKGICYYNTNVAFNMVLRNENVHASIDKCSVPAQLRIYNAYLNAFSPATVFIDTFVGVKWADFCGDQSYCGHLTLIW